MIGRLYILEKCYIVTFYTNTHTHIYIYIYIYICVCLCVCVLVLVDYYLEGHFTSLHTNIIRTFGIMGTKDMSS